MNEIQSDKLLKKAQELHKDLQEKLNRKVLEIDTLTESSNNEILLKRTIRSLEQYINKERSLIYIGFVGHYSSGKSSTLNNLFDFSGTENVRKTGLNPTDKAITLMTHPKNSNSLTLMTRNGGEVPIHTTIIDHPLLEKIVISDTPGSGDPDVVNEMIQDFLPICDIIIYLVSATNPIDQADLPLLKQKSDKLPFIPIKYVITRTDEFKVKRTQPLSNTNIDTPKIDLFKGQLISRVNEIFPEQPIKLNDLILIDNIDKYNIATLKEYIVSLSNNLNNQELVRIHGYKIEYYKRIIDNIYSYFLALIKNKVTQSQGYESTARENIQRFDKSSQINNEKMRMLWAKSLDKLNDTYQDELLAIKEITTSKYLESPSITKALLALKVEVVQKISQVSNGYYGNIVNDLNEVLKKNVRQNKEKLINTISNADFLTEDISEIFPKTLSFDTTKIPISINTAKIEPELEKVDTKLEHYFYDARSELIKSCQRLANLMHSAATITNFEEQYILGKESISENFDHYFDLIQMYRGAVLTRNNKETIEKLRIGTQLDELDQELNEQFVDSNKHKALELIFIPIDDAISNFKANVISLLTDISNLKTQLREINFKPITTSEFTLGPEEVILDSVVEIYVEEKVEKSQIFYNETLDNAFEEHTNRFIKFKKKKKEKVTARVKFIRTWSLIIGGLFMIATLFYYFIKGKTAASWTDAIIASLIANAIGGILSFLFLKLQKDSKTVEDTSSKEFSNESKNILIASFSDEFWADFKLKLEPKVNLSPSSGIKKRYTEISTEWQAKNRESFDSKIQELAAKKDELMKITDAYTNDLESLFNQYIKVFSEADNNSKTIQEVTQKIKNDSIEPSFDLLADTTKNLIKVKNKMIDNSNS